MRLECLPVGAYHRGREHQKAHEEAVPLLGGAVAATVSTTLRPTGGRSSANLVRRFDGPLDHTPGNHAQQCADGPEGDPSQESRYPFRCSHIVLS